MSPRSRHVFTRDEVIEWLLIARRARYSLATSRNTLGHNDPCGNALLTYLDGNPDRFTWGDIAPQLGLVREYLRHGDYAMAEAAMIEARVEAFIGAVLANAP